MTNFEFLKKYQKLQYGIMFHKIVDFGFAKISYCKGDKTDFWNWALVSNLITVEELSKIEQTFQSLKRIPAIYFENKEDLKRLVDFLRERGYKKSFEDSWMFWGGEKIDDSRFNMVEKVTSEIELKLFLETYDTCYQKDDPQNPYGELGDYLNVAEKVWHQHQENDRLEYFMVFKKDNPVAVSTLTNCEGIGYISNVGSLKEIRGQGYGKIASLYCVEQSKKNGNTEHCLATEKGTYPNEFYKRIGFNTRFTAIAYVKK